MFRCYQTCGHWVCIGAAQSQESLVRAGLACKVPLALPHFGSGRELVGALCWGRDWQVFIPHLFITGDRDESLKGGQRTLISLGHKSDSNLCKQNLVLVLDKNHM